MKQFLYRILCGFFLGLSVVAPGVSGGVIAVLLGIYDRLLTIVAHPFRHLRRHLVYLLPMGLGALFSLALFVLVFDYLFGAYPTATSLLFIGLIAGNLPFVLRQAGGALRGRRLAGAALAFALALGCGLLGRFWPVAEAAGLPSLAHIFLSGALAGIVGPVPGMSVSMILMMLGTYTPLIAAARALDLAPVAVFGVALTLAAVFFSRLVKWALRRHHDFSYAMILGFMGGSLATIALSLPAADPNAGWIPSLLGLLLGLLISFSFVWLGRRFNGEADGEDPGIT